MKMNVSIFLYIITAIVFPSVCLADFGHVPTENLVQEHGRLYFTRLHQKELADSVIRRNLNKARAALAQPISSLDKAATFLINKSRSEAFYLEAILSVRSTDFDKALMSIDSAARLQNVLGNAAILPDVSNVTFINTESVERFREATSLTRRNIVRMIVERLYQNKSRLAEAAVIGEFEKFPESIVNDSEIQRIYNYLKLKYLVEQKKCAEILGPFNVLKTRFRVFRPGNYVGNSSQDALVSDQSSQRIAEMASSPKEYVVIEKPSEEEVSTLLESARSVCPEMFKEGLEASLSEMAMLKADMTEKRPMRVLPLMPYTPCSFRPIKIKSDKFLELGDFKGFLDNKLRAFGYTELAYYGFEDGFAVFTPVEKFGKDGSPVDQDRFNLKMDNSVNTFFEYVNRLFVANTGYYRFIIFAVTSKPYKTDKKPNITYQNARDLFAKGEDDLSPELAAHKVNAGFKLDGYVYEFLQSEFASIPVFVNDCTIGVADHIKWIKLF